MPNYKVNITSIDNAELVKLSDMVEWLRIDETEEANLVSGLIKAARIRVENLANQDFVAKTRTIEIDEFVGKIETDIYPLGTVAVSYMINGVATNYPTNKVRTNGSVVTLLDIKKVDAVDNALTLTVISKPNTEYLEIAKIAIKLLVGKWYDNRASQKYEVPDMVEAIMMGVRITTC
jgi:hypothetical protein